MTDSLPETSDPFEDTNLFELPVLRHFEEQRRFPRIETSLPVLIETPKGERVKGVARNISPDGIQVRCGGKAATAVRPGGRAIRDDEKPLVRVAIRLPIEGAQETVVTRCRVTYVTPVRINEFAFGLEFMDLPQDRRDRIERYFSEQLTPRDDG